MSFSCEDVVVDIYSEIFFFREQKIEIFERFRKNKRIHSEKKQVQNNNISVQKQFEDYTALWSFNVLCLKKNFRSV